MSTNANSQSIMHIFILISIPAGEESIELFSRSEQKHADLMLCKTIVYGFCTVTISSIKHVDLLFVVSIKTLLFISRSYFVRGIVDFRFH